MWVYIVIAVVVVAAVATAVVWMIMKKRKGEPGDLRSEKSHDELIDESRVRLKRNYTRSKSLLELYESTLSEKNVAALKEIVGELEYASPSAKEEAEQCDNAIAAAINELSECLSQRSADTKAEQFTEQKLFEIRAQIKARAAEMQ